LQQQPRFVIPVRLGTALCAYLDRVEAREWLGRLLEPSPSTAPLPKVWFSPEFLGWYLAGLRRAGLPED
jgi:hypothetical protein